MANATGLAAKLRWQRETLRRHLDSQGRTKAACIELAVLGESLGEILSQVAHQCKLRRIARRSSLHVPARPGMAQVVPSKILDADSLQRRTPCFRVDLAHWLTSKAEHMR